MSERIIRIEEVLEMTGLSRSSLYRRVNDGTFPAPLRLGGDNSRAVGWPETEIADWIASLPRATETPRSRHRNTLAIQQRSDEASIGITPGDTLRDAPVKMSA